MLVLKSEKGEIHNLFTRKKHVVGRNGNLELEGDKSVSRQHAVVQVTIKDKKPQILLQDLGSKYGTFVNDGIQSATEIAKNTPTYLKIGDRIRFGQQWNTWTVEESQFVVCSSTLTPQEKTSLKSILAAMNGVLVSKWTDNCTHLTMNDIKITIKVVYALGSVKPIVNMDYWRTLSNIMKSIEQESIPDCDDYVPPLAEPSLMNVPTSFKMNNFRKRLFRDMTFVASTTAQYNSVLPMISNSGGTVIDGSRNTITEEQYEKEKILVLGSTTSVSRRNRNLAQILKYLEKNKHRCIAESEIGLSLVFCSMDKHCNPTYDASFMLRHPESQIVIKDEESILDLETQDLGDENSTQFFDDDSSKFSLAVNERRTFSESDEEQVISETQPPRTQTQSVASKRKLEEGTDKPNLKSTKLDNWLIMKKPAPKMVTSTESSQSVPVEKKTKSLFAFPRDRKTGGGSDSLFKTLNTSSSSEKSDSRKRSSIELFSTIESSPVPVKKQFVDLAQPSTSKQQRSLILFDSNESMDSFSEKTAKMNITNKPKPVVVDSPSVVPRNISLSQFVDVPKNKSNGEIKEESDDMTSEVKEVFDKTVVHTLPLVKINKTIIEPNSANRSAVNFKKFKKNNGFNRSCVISTNDLFLFKSKLEPRNDIQMNGDSDSSN